MPQINNYRIQKVNDVGIDKNINIINKNSANILEEKVAEPQ